MTECPICPTMPHAPHTDYCKRVRDGWQCNVPLNAPAKLHHPACDRARECQPKEGE